jgi:hypothetical protein
MTRAAGKGQRRVEGDGLQALVLCGSHEGLRELFGT